MVMNYPEFTVSDLEQGTQRGFIWLKIRMENGKTMLIVYPPKSDLPEKIKLDPYVYRADRGFYPFDDSISGYDVIGYHSQSWILNVAEWVDSLIARPQNCDLKIVYDTSKHKIRVVAKTMRNGRIIDVTKNLDNTIDPLPQIEKAYKYFAKNCPAAPEDQKTSLPISVIGQNLLTNFKPEGIKLFRKWLEQIQTTANPEREQLYFPDVTIEKSLIVGEQIERVTFSRVSGLGQILTYAELNGGHTYKEDKSGADVIIQMEAAQSIVVTLKGAPLSKALGIKGAEKVKIRNAVAKSIGDKNTFFPHLKLRTSIEVEEVKIPEVQEDSEEEVLQDIRNLMGPEGHFREADLFVAKQFEKMNPRQLREILSVLKAGGRPDLSEYGGPEVIIHVEYGVIQIYYSPRIKLKIPEFA